VPPDASRCFQMLPDASVRCLSVPAFLRPIKKNKKKIYIYIYIAYGIHGIYNGYGTYNIMAALRLIGSFCIYWDGRGPARHQGGQRRWGRPGGGGGGQGAGRAGRGGRGGGRLGGGWRAARGRPARGWLAGGQGAAGDQYIRNLALPRSVMEDLARIRWAKVTEGLLKVEVWAEQDFLAAIPK